MFRLNRPRLKRCETKDIVVGCAAPRSASLPSSASLSRTDSRDPQANLFRSPGLRDGPAPRADDATASAAPCETIQGKSLSGVSILLVQPFGPMRARSRAFG